MPFKESRNYWDESYNPNISFCIIFCIIRRMIEAFKINRKFMINRLQKICQFVWNFLERTKIWAVYLLDILGFFSRLCRWKPLSAVLLQLNEVAFSSKYFFPKINICIRTRKKAVSLKKKILKCKAFFLWNILLNVLEY